MARQNMRLAQWGQTSHRACALQLVLLASGLVLLGACGPDKEALKRERDMAAFAEAAERDADLADPLGRAVVELAQTVAPGWVKEGALLRGSLDERGRQAFLLVLKYGHCYRLLGVTDSEASDMDLLLFDANGVETQRDVTQGPTPVLGASAAICPAEAGAVRVEARMRSGRGTFAIALLHDPA